MDQNKMSNLYRGPSIDASYQVSVHLAMRFQKSSNQKQKLPVAAIFVNGSGRNEQSADFLNSSPLTPFGKMNRNLVGSIYGRSSVKIAHFVPIR
jgi:hypothetical protein